MPKMRSGGTMPSSADWITSSGAAEMTLKVNSWPSMPASSMRVSTSMLCFRRMRLPDFDEVLAAHLAVLGIVEQQIGQLGALLHEVGARQPGDLVVEPVGAEQLAQHDARIVEAQCLIEIAGDQIAASQRAFVVVSCSLHTTLED